jgi:WD40 repeat protein
VSKGDQYDNHPYARFLGGTIVLERVSPEVSPPMPFRWVNAKWRCRAVHYRTARSWLAQHGTRNRIPRWQTLSLALYDHRETHAYHREALQAWIDTERWGSVALPTCAGKTVLASGGLSSDPAVRIWNLADPSAEPFIIRGSYPNDLAFSPRGKYLAVAGGDAKIRLWDMNEVLLDQNDSG